MALTVEEIKKHILEAIPDASIEIKDYFLNKNEKVKSHDYCRHPS